MRCKPGDLAIIIRGTEGQEGPNVNKIVQCVRVELGFEGKPHSKYGAIWLVHSKGSDLITEHGGFGPYCHVPDDWLRPLPKDPPPPEETPEAMNDPAFKQEKEKEKVDA